MSKRTPNETRRNNLITKFIKKREHTIESEMSFFDHLNVLRRHLLRSVLAIFLFTIIAFSYREIVFDEIILGPTRLDFWTYRKMCRIADLYDIKGFCIDKINFVLMNTELAGQFMMHLLSSLVIGLACAVPYFLWELWRFIKPALHENERKYSSGLVLLSSALFAIGLSFGYFVVVPLTITFLSSYVVSVTVVNQITLNSYISTICTLSLGTGITFELPIVMYFLAKMGVVNARFLRANRRYAIILILLLSAFITPGPDIMTQLIVAFPLFLLYEISIFIVAYTGREK